MNNKNKTSPQRILVITLATLLLSIVFLKIWDTDFVYGYRQYFLAKDVINVNFKELSNTLTVEETQKKYPINWWCKPNDSDFGDYYCADELKGWNSIPAMLVIYWYKNEKLNYAKIDVPYWHHKTLITELKRKYGEPAKKSKRISYLNSARAIALFPLLKGKYSKDVSIDDLGLWELESGALLISELEPGANPFKWNTVFWIGPQAAPEHL